LADPVHFYLKLLFIYFRVEENEPKEDARVPLFPFPPPMLGAGQRG
jgi:hypothetical protein